MAYTQKTGENNALMPSGLELALEGHKSQNKEKTWSACELWGLQDVKKNNTRDWEAGLIREAERKFPCEVLQKACPHLPSLN